MNWGIFKTDSVSEAYKKMKAEESSCDKDMKKEELKGNQHKLDKNKNGKVDAHDFKLLRKEETVEETFSKDQLASIHSMHDKLSKSVGLDPSKKYGTIVTKKKSSADKVMDQAIKDEMKEEAEELAEMEFDKNGVYRHHAKPGVYGGSEKEKHVVDTLAGPKKSDLEKIVAKKKMKKEDLELFNERELDMLINEVLSKDAPAGKWIGDFVQSDAPQFAGKSTEKRKQMALAAYYSAQKNESTEYDSFLSEEGNPKPLIGQGAKEIKHANMKDKQDDQDVMEPHSEGEQSFVDDHSVLVTDEPNKDGTPNGADKTKRADEPKGKGPASYDAKEKLGKQGAVKEAVFKTAAGEEIDTTPQTKKDGDDKKKFNQLKKKVVAADSASNY
jgi:hypothetical protein